MTDELRAKMEELRAIAPRLNKTTDSASTIIKAVEDFLNGLGIGISAQATSFQSEYCDSEEGDEGTRSIDAYLAYGRYLGTFCIHVNRLTTKQERDPYTGFMQDVAVAEEQTSWSSCSREIKLKSFATLPKLLDNILSNAKEQAEAADKTAATVGEMMATLGIDATGAEAKPAAKGKRVTTS